MDTYFLAVDTVEHSPLQGRVEETLPDKGTVGVAVKDNPLRRVGMFQRACMSWRCWTGIAIVGEGDRAVE